MRLTEQVHDYLNAHLKSGDRAIDATAGNGYDTVQLAKLVGSSGNVTAIDIQPNAIEATERQLQVKGLLQQTELRIGDHAEILQTLCKDFAQTISAITFNLGYLPGSDKRIQTNPDTTLQALDASRELLKPGGHLLVTAYRGHDGGQAEADRVAEWMLKIRGNGWIVESREPDTRDTERKPPILWIARKN